MTPLSHTSTPPQVYSPTQSPATSDPPKGTRTPTLGGGPRPRPARRPLPQPQPQPPRPTSEPVAASSFSSTSSFSPLARQATAPAPVPPRRSSSSSATPPLQEMPTWPSKSVFASRVSTRHHSTPAPVSPLNKNAKPFPSAGAPAPSTPQDVPSSPRQMGPRHRRTDSGRRPLPSLPPPTCKTTPFSPPPKAAPPFPPTPSTTNSPAPTVTVASPPPMATVEPPEAKPEPPSKPAAPAVPTFSFPEPDDEKTAPPIPSTSVGLEEGDDKSSNPAPPPTIPSFAFDAPDEEQAGTTTKPPVPTIACFGIDEENERRSAPPIPSISAGSDEEDEGQGISINVPTLPGNNPPPLEHNHPHNHLDPNGPEPGSVPAQRAVSGSMPLGGGFCGGCSQILTGGKVIRALNKLWHPKCFRCDHCNTRLEHISFYVHDNHAYCHVDYHELFSKRCFHCQTPIVDTRFIAIDDPQLAGDKLRYYHDLHFFCASCGDPFVDPSRSASAPGQGALEDKEDEPVVGSRPFFTVKGYPYCERCHVQLHAPKCYSCRKPIQGAKLSALGKNWHPDCFVCAGCQKVFEGSRFFEHGGKAYDEDCYATILKSLH